MLKAVLWPGFPNVIEESQFDRGWYEGMLFPEARKMEKVMRLRQRRDPLSRLRHSFLGGDVLRGKTVDHLIYEASTRTLGTFMLATHYLGGYPKWIGDPSVVSSEVKGESLEDTIRMSNVYYIDAIVIRHPNDDGAHRAARVSNIPVIDAGSGSKKHPTQAMLDVYSMVKELGPIDGLRIALVGDIKNSRTINSLALTLPLFNVSEVIFVGPPLWKIRDEIKDYLLSEEVLFREITDLREVAADVDVVYLTRAQTERSTLVTRYGDPNRQCVGINDEVLERLNQNAVILHPLPRNDKFGELPEKYTDHPQVKIFDQAQNGLFIRMALLKMILG